ncbi:cytosine permease [Streptomyces sp. NPDC059533]|uniref:cytosine permease n=1 Tax=Streptomyces sp. NPDC059533 TaxID=3346858 RepID=UPI0036A7644F
MARHSTTLARKIKDSLRAATAVETSGVEPIPEDGRSGGPGSAFTLWFSANVQFSSLSSGMLATAAFGLGWSQALLAIALGGAVGAAAIGVMSTFGPRAVLVVGAIGGAIGWAAGHGDYRKSFEDFLILIGNWIAPWLAVMLVHRFLGRHDDHVAVRRFGAGFASRLLGLAAAVPFMSQPGVYVGPIAEDHPALGSCAAAVAFAAAGLTQYVLNRTRRRPATPDTGDTTHATPTTPTIHPTKEIPA